MAAELKETGRELEVAKGQLAAAQVDGLFENAADIDGVRVISAYLSGTGTETLRLAQSTAFAAMAMVLFMTTGSEAW